MVPLTPQRPTEHPPSEEEREKGRGGKEWGRPRWLKELYAEWKWYQFLLSLSILFSFLSSPPFLFNIFLLPLFLLAERMIKYMWRNMRLREWKRETERMRERENRIARVRGEDRLSEAKKWGREKSSLIQWRFTRNGLRDRSYRLLSSTFDSPRPTPPILYYTSCLLLSIQSYLLLLSL